MEQWEFYRYQRLTGGIDAGILGFQSFFDEIERLKRAGGLTAAQQEMMESLKYFGESIIPIPLLNLRGHLRDQLLSGFWSI